MYSLNKAQIIGYVTAKPEVKQLESKTSVANLDIEVRVKSYHNGTEPTIVSNFVTAVLWRRLAEIAGDYLDKGSQVYLNGRVETDSWEDDKGNKRYKTRIIVDDMILLSPKNGTLPSLSEELEISGGLNKVELVGNLTKDPELRTTPTGKMVTSFGLATNRIWRNSNDEQQEKTEFHNVVVWGNLAEEVSKHIAKGRKVYVCGRLQTRSWDSPEGEKRYTTEIIADEVKSLGHELFFSSSNNQSSSNTVKATATSTLGNDIPEINYESEINPEDLPF